MKPLYNKFSRSRYNEDGTLADFSVECPEGFNFAYDVADEIANQEPKKTALVWCDTEGHEKIISFSELKQLSNRAANCLARFGIKKGDKVMLMLKRHYEYWYTILALHKIGAVAVPATHMLKKNDIAYRANAVGISAVICAADDDITENVLAASEEASSLTKLFCIRKSHPGFYRLDEEMEKESDSFDRVLTNKHDPFILYFTSGTTGEPKPVEHNYEYPLAHIVTARDWQGVKEGGLHLSVADTGWGKASWGKIYGQWLCSAAVMVFDYDRFVPEQLLEVIKKYHVTSFCAPPTVYRLIMKCENFSEAFLGVEQVTTAGEPMNPEHMKRFFEQTGLAIREGYGQTETALLIAELKGCEARFGTMGKSSPQYKVFIADDNGNEITDGSEGEIVVSADRTQAGLCICREESGFAARAWKNGVYHTGDIASRDEDGYFRFVGRKDDIIKSSGYRISPFEIENVLVKHPAVFECAVTGVPDEERGLVVKASIVLNSGFSAGEELAKELKNFVKTNTAPYKYPRIVEFVKTLPKTISGKIRRNEIRKKDESVLKQMSLKVSS